MENESVEKELLSIPADQGVKTITIKDANGSIVHSLGDAGEIIEATSYLGNRKTETRHFTYSANKLSEIVVQTPTKTVSRAVSYSGDSVIVVDSENRSVLTTQLHPESGERVILSRSDNGNISYAPVGSGFRGDEE